MPVPHLPLITPETARLRLRQWRADDLAPFAALNADAEVMRYFPAPMSRPDSDAMAERMAGLITLRGWGFWAVERKDSGAFIGIVGLNVPRPELPCYPCVEMGWRLARAHWRQGYALEAAQAALQVGFATLQLPEIVAFTALPNLPSQGVMEKLGMQRDAANFEHPAVPEGSPLRTHCLYRITQAQWLAGQPPAAIGR
ncbi:hypothetical protein IGB42_02483 [Andreprevotia sp. IGB-42]|nr:hypothetical protein IGB42_02483 [Andreprevotia sp. IGB-42]